VYQKIHTYVIIYQDGCRQKNELWKEQEEGTGRNIRDYTFGKENATKDNTSCLFRSGPRWTGPSREEG